MFRYRRTCQAEEVVIVVQAHLIEINAQFNGDKHKSSYCVRAAGERVSLGVIQCRIMDVVQSIGADRGGKICCVFSVLGLTLEVMHISKVLSTQYSCTPHYVLFSVCCRACVDTG